MSKGLDPRKPPNGRRTPRRDARATPAEVLKMLSQGKAQRPAEPAAPPAASRFKNQLKPNQTPEASVVAALMVDGVLMNAVTAVAFSKTLGTVDLTESVAALVAEIRRVQGGHLDAAEALLMAQAVALNAMFTHLAAQTSTILGRRPEEATVLATARKSKPHANRSTISQMSATLPTWARSKKSIARWSKSIPPSSPRDVTRMGLTPVAPPSDLRSSARRSTARGTVRRRQSTQPSLGSRGVRPKGRGSSWTRLQSIPMS
jgi:hypothetical protein